RRRASPRLRPRPCRSGRASSSSAWCPARTAWPARPAGGTSCSPPHRRRRRLRLLHPARPPAALVGARGQGAGIGEDVPLPPPRPLAPDPQAGLLILPAYHKSTIKYLPFVLTFVLARRILHLSLAKGPSHNDLVRAHARTTRASEESGWQLERSRRT